MSQGRYAIGVDFGSESGRAVVVDANDGTEVAVAISRYRNGVITDHLPAPFSHVRLKPEWALQDPEDYIRVLAEAIPAALREADVDAENVIGVGIDFTSCTMLPATATGTPLCCLPELRAEPHAWVKLWKHHAAQPEADRITSLAVERGEPWLARYGGRISSEWFFAKSLQILDEAPEVYARADRLVEAADWIVWQLTGVETRNNCAAGYKAIWSPDAGFPSPDFFAALDPRFADVVDAKLSRDVTEIGRCAGTLCERAAALTGLRPGTPVAVANVDAHVSVPAVGATTAGTMVIVMGTSNCHVLLGDRLAAVEGMSGVVRDGVLPGLYGYEAGQSAVGDIFAWFADHAVPDRYRRSGDGVLRDTQAILEQEAARLAAGESGLLALDWWNGNRSILVDTELSGVIVGMTLGTRPPEVYRALLEATAFGTRMIIDAFEAAGVPVTEIVACGGLPQRNRLLMQIYADVTGREIAVAASTQAPALGAAMFAAVSAGSTNGGYDSIVEASRCMAPRELRRFRPDPERHAVYNSLYEAYCHLHDVFGRGDDTVIKTLWRIRRASRERVTVQQRDWPSER